MEMIYARESLPDRVTRTVFLAGPTPRSRDTASWRPDALDALRRLGFDGHVFVPEPRDGPWQPGYEDQIEWEDAALSRADVILFWIPRDLARLPGLTTNDEFGFWKGRDPARVILGAPEGAASVRYQQHYAAKLGIPVCKSLDQAARAALELLGDGAARSGGECLVLCTSGVPPRSGAGTRPSGRPATASTALGWSGSSGPAPGTPSSSGHARQRLGDCRGPA